MIDGVRAAASSPLLPLLIAICSLGLGLAANDGIRSPVGLTLVALSLLEAWLFVLARRAPARAHSVAAEHLALTASAVGLLTVTPVRLLSAPFLWLYVGLVGAMLGAGVLLVRTGSLQRRQVLLVTICGLAGALGLVMLTALPQPKADVLLFQRDSLRELLRGINPYTITFPDPYTPEISADFYGPGVSVDGVLMFGYPYLPLTLFTALPGHLLGDVRYASLLAVLASALLIGFSRDTRSSCVGAALLIMTPAFPVMLRTGWVDTYVVLGVACTWFIFCRRPHLLPYAVGLLFASKQYLVVSAPILFLLCESRCDGHTRMHFLLRAIGTACVVTLPLALWDVPAFLHSAAWLQFRQPFRIDSLSFVAWLSPTDPQHWVLLPFALVTMSWAVLLRMPQQNRVSFPLALALTFAVFFAFNKQAFLNYYYLVIGCLCCAMAAEGGTE